MPDKLFCLIIMALASLEATTSIGVFQKYPNKHFIETGSYVGEGIQNAIAAGFQEIHSIELSLVHYLDCCDRFRSLSNIHLFLGDSSSVLPMLLNQIDAPATFWLDSHYSFGTTAKGKSNTPLLAELEAIDNHLIRTHTILIDDVRLFGTEEFDYIPLEGVIRRILQINPDYDISFEDGLFARDVLVAKVKK